MGNINFEDFLLSELEEVKGGLTTKDCHCISGAGEMIVVSPNDPPGFPGPGPNGPVNS